MSVSVRLFMGSARIALASYAYSMHMYLFPLLDVTGNRPVWLVYNLPMGLMLENKICVGLSSCSTSGSRSFGLLDCIDLIYFRVLSRCNLLVTVDLGRCLATALAVRPVKEAKTPFWMALIPVMGTGLNTEVCKYCMCSDLVVGWYALLHSGIFLVVSLFALVRGK